MPMPLPLPMPMQIPLSKRSTSRAARPLAPARRRVAGLAPVVASFVAATMAMAANAAAAGTPGAPPAGRYDGQLCVTPASAPQQCGPAVVDMRSPGSARVRIDDIRYALTLHSSQVDVVLMHGAMQIDGFTAQYEWQGSRADAVLQFVDADKRVRYEVRFGKPAPAQR
jgi:hypothetical protein